MLLPRAPLDTLLFLSALRPLNAPLLRVLLPVVLDLPLLLLSVLLPVALILPLLLLSVLLLPLFRLPLLLSMLLRGPGLLVPALLLGMVLLFALLFVLWVSRSSDSEKQRQSRCADDSNYLHKCYLHYCWLCTLA